MGLGGGREGVRSRHKDTSALGFVPSLRFNVTQVRLRRPIAGLGMCLSRSFYRACRRTHANLRVTTVTLVNVQTLARIRERKGKVWLKGQRHRRERGGPAHARLLTDRAAPTRTRGQPKSPHLPASSGRAWSAVCLSGSASSPGVLVVLRGPSCRRFRLGGPHCENGV